MHLSVDFAAAFESLGVARFGDLSLVEESDLDAMGMKKIPQRRFLKARSKIQTVCTDEYQVDRNPGLATHPGPASCLVVAWLSDGRRMVVGRSSTAPVSSAAPKKKAFDRGGPVWPPRSNAADDRLGGGSGGQRPPAKTEQFF